MNTQKLLHLTSIFVLYWLKPVNSECNEIISYSSINWFGEIPNPFGECSGRGTCELEADNLTTFCSCDDGWAGLSDWVNTELQDCQINEPAIKALWAIVLIASIAAVVFGSPTLYSRWVAFLKKKDDARSRGQQLKAFDHRPLISCVVHYSICMPSVIVLALLRLADPSQRVGVTWGMTILFITGKIGFYIFAWLFQPSLLSLLLTSHLHGKTAGLELILRLANLGGLAAAFLSIALGFLPLFVIFYPEIGATMFSVYMTGMSFSMVWYFFQAMFIKKRANEILVSFSKKNNSSMDTVRKKVNKLQNEVIIQASVQLLLYLAFLLTPFLTPFLYNKHDYFLPVSWLAFAWLGYKAVHTHVDRSRSDSDMNMSKRASKLITNAMKTLTRTPSKEDDETASKGSKSSLKIFTDEEEITSSNKRTEESI